MKTVRKEPSSMPAQIREAMQSRSQLRKNPRETSVERQPFNQIAKKQAILDAAGIYCSIDSVENYIRRAVNKIGWMEPSSRKSEEFHIKFDVADVDVKTKPHQFYNHFPDNRELTTKAGLCKNLWT